MPSTRAASASMPSERRGPAGEHLLVRFARPCYVHGSCAAQAARLRVEPPCSLLLYAPWTRAGLGCQVASAVKYHLRGRSLAAFLATSSYKCNLGRDPRTCNFTKGKSRPGPWPARVWRVLKNCPAPGHRPSCERFYKHRPAPPGDPGPLSCFHAASCVMTRLQQIAFAFAINRYRKVLCCLYQEYNSKKCEPMIDPRAPLLQKISLAIHPRPLKGCRLRAGGGGQGARGSLRPDRDWLACREVLRPPVVAARRRLRAEARLAPWLALTVRHQGEGTARGRVVAAEARARAREWSASGACGLGDVSRSVTAPTVPPPLPGPA